MATDARALGRVLKERLTGFAPSIVSGRTGRVTMVGDGIATLSGLPDCMAGELLRFENDVFGLAMNLEANNVGVVLLGDDSGISEGEIALATGRVIEVPVGAGFMGRVINPIGAPIDGKGPIKAEAHRPIEHEAPGILHRQSVNTPLQTGLMAIDALVPIGRGQRELIIGDRQTGKTAIAIDTILAQRDQNVLCIYVAIGQKASTVSQIVSTLERHKAFSYTALVVSTASDPAPLQYIAPYAGCALAEHFMESGRDVLIVYDDLSKHAVAYRAMSLLLRRPPGREAYPGDVFYLHSRLLERAAKLSPELGGGSMTALPIIETMSGDISAYIPTNVISITDGQIFLESELFYAGVRPAVNVGLSVSRVGGAAQLPGMRHVAGPLRLQLAQYRELKAFAQFGSDLDASTQELLRQGERLTEALKQEQFAPMPAVHQIVLLSLLTSKVIDNVPLSHIGEFRRGFFPFLQSRYTQLLEDIAAKGDIGEMEDHTLKGAAQRYFELTAIAETSE